MNDDFVMIRATRQNSEKFVAEVHHTSSIQLFK